MKANAPTKVTLLVAVVLAVFGVIGKFIAIPFVSEYAFYLLLAGFVVLLLGCILKGK